MMLYSAPRNAKPLAYYTLFVLSALAVSDVLADEYGQASADFRLRYESVSQNNALKDAKGLTLDTTLRYFSPVFNGLSVALEWENNRSLLSLDDFNDAGISGSHLDYSVIADPDTSEWDQGYVQYHQDGWTARVGRQVLAWDNQRFIGHVGWRQDKQTFDGASLTYKDKSGISASYAYIDQRNRIFAEQRDIDSSDHLLNLSYDSGSANYSAYGYFLESPGQSLDTLGLSFSNKVDYPQYSLLIHAETAYQRASVNHQAFAAPYLSLEGGMVANGVTYKLGYEALGSDGGDFGFITPLATLHKFNGWSDQFLNTPKGGLQDRYVSVAGKLFGGKWLAAYHVFHLDHPIVGSDALGDEINILFSRAFAESYSAGIKYAAFNAKGTGYVDTDKIWVWLTAKFG